MGLILKELVLILRRLFSFLLKDESCEAWSPVGAQLTWAFAVCVCFDQLCYKSW